MTDNDLEMQDAGSDYGDEPLDLRKDNNRVKITMVCSVSLFHMDRLILALMKKKEAGREQGD